MTLLIFDLRVEEWPIWDKWKSDKKYLSIVFKYRSKLRKEKKNIKSDKNISVGVQPKRTRMHVLSMLNRIDFSVTCT